MAIENVFGEVESLAHSNSDWIKASQKSVTDLVTGIEKQLDNVEAAIKNSGKSGCDVSDLYNIYSIRLDVYETIVNLMNKINDGVKSELEIQKKMYDKEYQEYKDILEVLKHTDFENSQI